MMLSSISSLLCIGGEGQGGYIYVWGGYFYKESLWWEFFVQNSIFFWDRLKYEHDVEAQHLEAVISWHGEEAVDSLYWFWCGRVNCHPRSWCGAGFGICGWGR